MKIDVNGKETTVDEGLTIGALIDQVGADPNKVAVVVNDEIAPRAERNAIALKEGDRVELITFAGGG